MTLLSNKRFTFGLELQKEDGIERGEKFMLGPVSRIKLPSKYGRCALFVDIVSPTTPTLTCRLVNVHPDSIGDNAITVMEGRGFVPLQIRATYPQSPKFILTAPNAINLQ
ncbi:hypothetical protein BDR04DRAFT_1095807 [Suillus decipiens]|nr:hypothetical protein BDR04DRAFT_1095807 [Suillus decipiens]